MIFETLMKPKRRTRCIQLVFLDSCGLCSAQRMPAAVGPSDGGGLLDKSNHQQTRY